VPSKKFYYSHDIKIENVYRAFKVTFNRKLKLILKSIKINRNYKLKVVSVEYFLQNKFLQFCNQNKNFLNFILFYLVLNVTSWQFSNIEYI